MLIADSQVHVWASHTAERPWQSGQHVHQGPPLSADDLLVQMDLAGVSRAILVPPGLDGYRNDLVLDAARRYPDRFAAMGRFDLAAPGARERVSTWCQEPGMVGMRFSFTLPDTALALAESRIDWLWEEAQNAQVPIMALVNHSMVHLIDDVAARYPRVKLIMCHLGLATGKQDDEAFRDFDNILILAKRPNVAVKATALPAYTTDVYPYRQLHPYLRRVYDAFGAQRVFWGTDLSRLPCTYQQAITMFTEEMPWLSQADKEWTMGLGLCEWLHWKPPAAVLP